MFTANNNHLKTPPSDGVFKFNNVITRELKSDPVKVQALLEKRTTQRQESHKIEKSIMASFFTTIR